MTTCGDCQIWERQPYDSETGYRFFWTDYVMAPDGERSYLNAYNRYRARHDRPPADILPGNWRLWAQCINRQGKRLRHRHTWAERYAAYEQFVAEERRKALHSKILEDATNWAKMQETALEKEREYADKLYQKAETMLQFPIFNRRTRVKDGVTQIIVEPANWKLADISTVLRLASDLKRRGLLMPPQGAIPEDSWRSTLLQLGLDPDDPNEWIDFLARQPDAETKDAGQALFDSD